MRNFERDIVDYWRCRQGNIALLSALLLPLVLLFAGAAIDFGRWTSQQNKLKEAADALSILGAREFLLANATQENIQAVVDAAVENGAAARFETGAFSHNVVIDDEQMSVTVTLSQPPKPGVILTNFSPYGDQLNKRSTAIARGGVKVCVVALEDHDDGAFDIQMNAKLQADDCSVFSNSDSTEGIEAQGAARVTAGLICTAGGYSGAVVNYNPTPTTDCPIYDDPLIDRTPATVSGCDYDDVVLGDPTIDTAALSTAISVGDGATGGLASDLGLDQLVYDKYTLDPGIYCGGINIGSNADVTLNPGIYVMKDGPLAVALGGRLTGEHVSFHLIGDNAVFYFGAQSTVELSATTTGALAGILFFEDRSAPEGRLHQILSGNARKLIGTFYLPRGTMRVASLVPVADHSAYTAIVARKLSLSGSPTLVLNSNYSSTDVPVPNGVGPVGGTTYLRE